MRVLVRRFAIEAPPILASATSFLISTSKPCGNNFGGTDEPGHQEPDSQEART